MIACDLDDPLPAPPPRSTRGAGGRGRSRARGARAGGRGDAIVPQVQTRGPMRIILILATLTGLYNVPLARLPTTLHEFAVDVDLQDFAQVQFIGLALAHWEVVTAATHMDETREWFHTQAARRVGTQFDIFGYVDWVIDSAFGCISGVNLDNSIGRDAYSLTQAMRDVRINDDAGTTYTVGQIILKYTGIGLGEFFIHPYVGVAVTVTLGYLHSVSITRRTKRKHFLRNEPSSKLLSTIVDFFASYVLALMNESCFPMSQPLSHC